MGGGWGRFPVAAASAPHDLPSHLRGSPGGWPLEGGRAAARPRRPARVRLSEPQAHLTVPVLGDRACLRSCSPHPCPGAEQADLPRAWGGGRRPPPL